MTGTLHPHPEDKQSMAQVVKPCTHPATRRYAWIARDDSVPGGDVLVVACCDCGAVLQGGVDEAQP